MDSPVIVDAASKFGEIDLDPCSFPGFPFDDDTYAFERPRGDGIRAHLDNLAARHPELAEHLRGPPWPFGGSLLRDRRRRRRGSGSSNNDDQQQQGQQHQVDEDARSQASGSSAASGASAVSSHSGGGGSGEQDLTSSSAIPQYGLRNTVDIGQQQRRRGMETSPEKGERGQRSMSAPPESWQQQQLQQQGQDQQQQQPQSGQGQRFVSRVDITPQHNQQRAQSPSKPASNVRHIPIYVEGRDVPVMPKVAADDTPASAFQHHHQRQSSPSSHHFERSSPPPHHFHRPTLNERFSRQQWPPSHFQDTFCKPAGFEQPIRRQQQHQEPQYYYQQPQHHEQQYQQQPQYQHEQHQQQQPQPQQPQYHQQEQQQQQQQEEETPKPKPPVPKDPLEKVAQVQKEVDDLAEQVRRYVGGSRQDKEYMYLDEMLTRELIKLDDIETEGRENVRQTRKNAIKSIQDTISLLETKAPLANQQKQQLATRGEVKEGCAEKNQRGEEITQVSEPMEVDVKQEKRGNEPIPLPPAPSSPTKTHAESSGCEGAITAAESANRSVASAGTEQTANVAQKTEQKTENPAAENMKQSIALTSTDETSKELKPRDGKDGEQRKDGVASETTANKDATSKQQAEEATKGKAEVNDGQRGTTESPRLQKKAKKTKKKEQQQQPVSEQAIPLPPPPPTERAK